MFWPRRRASTLVTFGLALLVPAPVVASPQPATPQRPSFSSDPNTTAAGTIELEAGFLAADEDLRDLPLTLKWGSGPRTEFYLGWSPWTQTARSSEWIGDTSIGVRHRFRDAGSGPVALAYQLAAKIPTADPVDGRGVVDALLALTGSWTQGHLTGVTFYQLGINGRPGEDGVLVEHALAQALGIPLSGRWSAFGEWTFLWRPEFHSSDNLALVGTAFALRPWLVFDAAAGLAMVPGDDHWNATLGTTVNFGGP